MDPPLFILMTYTGLGLYQAIFTINLDGPVTIDIVIAKNGGLLGHYYNNGFLDGTPVLVLIDLGIDFYWGFGLITAEASDFVSIRWIGKLLAPSTEYYTFIIEADDGVRLYIDDVLLIDSWDSCCDDVTGIQSLVENDFYEIRLEYKENQEEAYIKLMWSSLTTPKQVIPANGKKISFNGLVPDAPSAPTVNLATL